MPTIAIVVVDPAGDQVGDLGQRLGILNEGSVLRLEAPPEGLHPRVVAGSVLGERDPAVFGEQ